MASSKQSKEEKKKSNEKKGKEAGSKKSTNKKTQTTKSKQEKKKSNNKRTANGTTSKVFIISSSSTDLQEVEKIEEEHEKRSENKNRGDKSSKIKKTNNKRKKEKEKDENDADVEEDETTSCRFPTARIRRIIKSEDSSLQLTQDAVFLVNKATEKFLEKFCEEAYECSVRDRKKSLAYNHLSSVVSKRRRFDFLSDFIPEKLKAEDALAERKLAEATQG